MEEILYKWIPSVGFPIAIAIYLLIRIEPKLTQLTDIIRELVTVVKIDSENSRDVKNAIVNFTVGISDLRNEITKLGKL